MGKWDERPLGLPAFEKLADGYAALVETKAHNAYYERPATLSLLPDIRGLRVLDAGCGPGVYAELLLERGAEVVCLDGSTRMVELARERLGSRALVLQGDLGQPLEDLADADFDVIVAALVVDYIRDWLSLFREFRRVLKRGGRVVFSIEHPFSDFSHRHMTSYFETEVVECTWRGFATPVEVSSYRRPLAEILNPVLEAGFLLERVLEPLPTREFEKADPEDYAKLVRRPGFLCLRVKRY